MAVADSPAARSPAWTKYKLADHMLTQTYPLLGDPKLLLATVENLHLAIQFGLKEFLGDAARRKEIPLVPESFEAQLELYRERVRARKLPDHTEFLRELRSIIDEHRASPAEFARKDAFVLCGDDRRLRTVSTESIKKYLAQAKAFLTDLRIPA
jgi:hypothetical protein